MDPYKKKYFEKPTGTFQEFYYGQPKWPISSLWFCTTNSLLNFLHLSKSYQLIIKYRKIS
jgi:hypothetical protein